MPIRCEIVSQDRLVFEGDADIVLVPGDSGMMGILPNHSPLLSTLKMGVLTVRNKDQEINFTISGGVVEVQPTIITVMADAAENVEEIDLARAQDAKHRAEELLSKTPQMEVDAYLALEAAIKRSNLRIEAAKRYRSSRSPFDTREENR